MQYVKLHSLSSYYPTFYISLILLYLHKSNTYVHTVSNFVIANLIYVVISWLRERTELQKGIQNSSPLEVTTMHTGVFVKVLNSRSLKYSMSVTVGQGF